VQELSIIARHGGSPPVGRWFWFCLQNKLSRSSPAIREMRRSDSLQVKKESHTTDLLSGCSQDLKWTVILVPPNLLTLFIPSLSNFWFRRFHYLSCPTFQ